MPGPGEVPRLLLVLPPTDDARVPGVLARPIPKPGVVGLAYRSLPGRGVAEDELVGIGIFKLLGTSPTGMSTT